MREVPTRVLTIRGGAEQVRARRGTEADWPGIVEVNCSAPDMPWPRPPEEMTPEERSEYGGFWMSLETLRELYSFYVERDSPILVAQDSSGRIVAHIDLWLAEEPAPVGRSAFVEIVVEHAEYLGSGLENAFLGYAAEVARALGYPALDGSFGIGGLSTDYFEKRAMGFRIWDEHDRVQVACRPGTLPELRAAPATGEALRQVAALGRWAPSEYIWRFRTEAEVHRLEVEAGGARCLVEGLGAEHVRGAAGALDASFFVPADRRHDAGLIGELLRVYAAYGAENGYRSFETFLPCAVTGQLSGLEITSAAYAGTCLRMSL